MRRPLGPHMCGPAVRLISRTEKQERPPVVYWAAGEEGAVERPMGQDTPVPPRPQ